MAIVIGRPLIEVSLEVKDNGCIRGCRYVRWRDLPKEEWPVHRQVAAFIATAIAGPLRQRVLRRRWPVRWLRGARRRAMLRLAAAHGITNADLADRIDSADRVLRGYWGAVECVAHELLLRERVSASYVRAVLTDARAADTWTD